MKTIQNLKSNRILEETLWAFVFAFILTVLVIGYWLFVPGQYIVRGIQIENVPVGMMTPSEAHSIIKGQLPPLPEERLVLNWQEQVWSTPAASLDWNYNLDQVIAQAYAYGHQGSPGQRLQERVHLLWTKPNLKVLTAYDQEKLEKWIDSISQTIDQPGRQSAAIVQGSTYHIDQGEIGYQVKKDSLIKAINQNPNQHSFSIPVSTVLRPLEEEDLPATKERLHTLWPKKIEVIVSELEPSFVLSATDFFPWLQLPTGFKNDLLLQSIKDWNKQYSRESQNAQFEIKDNQLTTFVPDRAGRQIDLSTTHEKIQNLLTELAEPDSSPSAELKLDFVEVEPDVKLSDTNDLGVNELIGVGKSTYFHSIPNRVFNVGLTAQRIDRALIAPEEEFSFNRQVGEVSGKTGYKTAYVIRDGRTQLGDGGGVCQVSTTVFRAALDAGLPFVEWHPHSYRVGYYEQNQKAGFDATVYGPTVDLRFKNDTPGHLVVATYTDVENRFLRVEIWGSSDGRQSNISNYKMYNLRSAPAPLFEEDPSLPTGTRKQIDWAAQGATTQFDYHVKSAAGDVIYQRTFRSVFQPWQAVYLVGTG